MRDLCSTIFLFFMAIKAAIKIINVTPLIIAFNKGKNENNGVFVLGKKYKIATAIGITTEKKIISDVYFEGFME